jgi:hypothetical protein
LESGGGFLPTIGGGGKLAVDYADQAREIGEELQPTELAMSGFKQGMAKCGVTQGGAGEDFSRRPYG